MFPDISTTSINGKSANEVVDKTWYEKEFIPIV
jgi:malate/lactate dehydrogenase